MKQALILALLCVNLCAWSFTQKDFDNLSPSQLEVIDVHYLTGEQRGLGLRLAAITIAETQAGKLDFKDNHICGAAQLDYTLLDNVTCEQLEGNPYISAYYALQNLLDWTTGIEEVTLKPFTRTLDKATMMYCVGYTQDPHQHTYLARVKQAELILQQNGY